MKPLFLFLLAVSIFSPIYSQITFRHTIGGTGQDQGRSVKQTFDGGYIVAGSTSSFGLGNSDVYLIKLDSLGMKQWSNVYGGSNVDWGYSVVQSPDSTYVICGYTNSFGMGGYDFYLIKVDLEGNLLWQKNYGGADWDFAYSLQNTSDGGFIIAGETYSFGSGSNDMYLIKTNSNGDVIWTKTYGGQNKDYAKSVKQTFDGGYIIAGGTASFGSGMTDVYIVKTDDTGDSLWTKTFGGDSVDFANSIIQTSDSGYAVAASSNSFSDGNYDYYIFKTDPNGSEKWNHKWITYLENDEATEIVETNNGLAFFGSTSSVGPGGFSFQLVFTDINGWYVAIREYGSEGEEIGYSLAETEDNGFVMCGSADSYGFGYHEILIIKTDSIGLTGISGAVTSFLDSIVLSAFLNFEKSSISLKFFPNPFHSSSRIQFEGGLENEMHFELYDLLGNKVQSMDFICCDSFEIVRENVQNGIYLYKLKEGNVIKSAGKLVIF